MTTTTRRANQPALSGSGEQVLARYEHQIRIEEDLAHATIHNYPSDLRHFAAWCEFMWKQGRETELSLTPDDFCHRFGYRMAKTVPLHRLAQLMDHDSLDTTMLYVQGTRDDLQQVVETIA